MLKIDQQIAETRCDEIRAMFPNAPYPAYDYQCAAYRIAGEEIRSANPEPAVIEASVSAGKTDMIAMLCARFQQMNNQQAANGREPYQVLVISRDAAIVDQDAKQMWKYGVQNSLFCSGLGRKSSAYPIIAASEGTLVNALFDTVRPGKEIRLMTFRNHVPRSVAHFSVLQEKIKKAIRIGEMKDFAPFTFICDEGHHVNVDDYCASELAGESYREMLQNKRTLYTIIIRTLQQRCRDKHGKEMRMFCYTGSPWRDNRQIVNENRKTPGLWRKTVIKIDTPFLCREGAVVPYRFGDNSGLHYDITSVRASGEDGIRETSADLEAMEKEILKQGIMTKKIMLEVQRIAADRNGVLVTCAGKKHCQEAADALLPGTTYIIITDDMGQKKRMQAMEDMRAGKYKYVFQIGCLTTGVNVPYWDVGVILRKIGSITLLTQLNGRIIRLFNHEEIPGALPKNDALILDYSGTMDELGEVFFDPQIEQYQYEQAEINEDYQTCPVCDGHNSPYARRCIHTDGFGNRCEHWFKFKECAELRNKDGVLLNSGCSAKNDPCARYCGNCGGVMIDPNAKLDPRHYTEGDYYNVLDFRVRLTKDQQALVFEYTLDDRNGGNFLAKETFLPESNQPWARNAFKANAVRKHIASPSIRAEVSGIKSAVRLMSYAQYFMRPKQVSHRKPGGKKDIIANKIFA